MFNTPHVFQVAKEALEEFFDDYTVAEWIEQRVYPLYQKLQEIRETAQQLSKRKYWSHRPLPINQALSAFGIGNGFRSAGGAGAAANPSVIKYRRSYLADNAVQQQPAAADDSPSTQRPKRLVQQPDYYRNPPSVQIGA